MTRTPATPTLLDRAIAQVSPRWAVNRLRDRTALALASGGYFHGSRRGRAALSNWNPGVSDADGDISPDLVDLRAYSRDLARTSALAGGAINTVVTNVVGTGLALQPTPDADFLGLTPEQIKAWTANATREFKLWAETTDCDITRTQNFYQLQSLAFRSVLESGDVISLPTMQGTGRPYQLALQMIEADRLCNPANGADKPTLVAGVEFTEGGAPIRYHIAKTHPGARMRSGNTWTAVDAFGAQTGRRNVLHLFERRRPGQTRGVPYLASVIEPLKQLTRYSEAEISAAVVSAAFAVFVKMDHEAFQSLFDENTSTAAAEYATNRWDGTVGQGGLSGPGKAVNLLPGESIEAPALGRPNSEFDPFVQAILRQIGVGLELPFEVLIKHFTASYSAARAALLDAWRFFRGRRDWLVTVFCQPVYELWLEEAVALGRISAPGFFADPQYRRAWSAAVWTGDGPGSIDPYKEVNAAKERIAQGISTIAAESILHDGVDWETKHRQRVIENDAREAAGLNQDTGSADPFADPEDTNNNGSGGSPAQNDKNPNKPSRGGAPVRRAENMAATVAETIATHTTTRRSHDLITAMPIALEHVLQNHRIATQEMLDGHANALIAQAARDQAEARAAAPHVIEITNNIAASEAPNVSLEAVHHHHVNVAAAAPANVDVTVEAIMPAADVPAVDVYVTNSVPAAPAPVWPARRTETTIHHDDVTGDMIGSTSIEQDLPAA